MSIARIAAQLAAASVAAFLVAGVACGTPRAAEPTRPGSASASPDDAGAALEPSDDEKAAALMQAAVDASAAAEQQRREWQHYDREAAAEWRPGRDDGSDICLDSFTDNCCGDVASHGKRVRGTLVCPKGQVAHWMCRGTQNCHPRF